jgi:ABC-type Fe3+/spermidine/putrescine transport system ATPase subunit
VATARPNASETRRVAVVPQEGALFPHLTVAGNVSYGLSRAHTALGGLPLANGAATGAAPAW